MKNGSKKGFLLAKIDFAFLPTAFIVYWILVYCRVGSLEIQISHHVNFMYVYCRVGSLENSITVKNTVVHVYCRVGSIEIYKWRYNQEIHCLLNRLKIVIFKEGDKGDIISNKQQITDAVFELSVFFFTKVNN